MKFIKIIIPFSILLGLLSACTLWLPNQNIAEMRPYSPVKISLNKQLQLSLPTLTEGLPRAGIKVSVTAPEYQGTQVYHTLYLPDDWSAEKVKQGQTWPVMFEYTGNKYAKSGSTGEVKDAAFGYGLTAGKYIWVSLPYISANKSENQLTWWGDKEATVNYAKANVPRVLQSFGGEPSAVFLCGFSRGAIAVNYLGLHDDEIAQLWSGFIVHDHFDGEQEWKGTSWGSPFATYQKAAAERLKRVNGRPYLITSVPSHSQSTKTFIQQYMAKTENFTYLDVNTRKIFGTFPNGITKGGHTDKWPLVPSEYRIQAWQWLNKNVASK
ncbi:hypothetical protein [Paraglaciecola sp. L3A3]|uniref:hypothetical protein n=1 Tax=Paraglaciecola sp. L3A3 TaxID=2686358 RepID=UPI00131B544E|nr:hypothetical protein [Paraglaciecola sp. L3A3]